MYDEAFLEAHGIEPTDFDPLSLIGRPSMLDPKQDRSRPYGDEGEYMNPDGAF